MNENIDQFGRSNKGLNGDKISDNINLDQSKKIRQSLAEIKEQLIQENFKIQNNEDLQANKKKIEPIDVNTTTKTIKELENKIKTLEFEYENKLNDKFNYIVDRTADLDNNRNFEKKNNPIERIANNIFFELDSQLKPLTSNAILVINKKNLSKEKISIINKIIYMIIIFLFIYFLSVFISLSKNDNLNELNIFGKDYLIKFLEIINYI